MILAPTSNILVPHMQPQWPRGREVAAGGGGVGLLTNLVSYWKMDEASGARADAVGSNNLAQSNTISSATGKINDAASFTANSRYLSVASNSTLEVGDIDFTWSLWYKPADVFLRVLLDKGNGGGNNSDYEYGIYTDFHSGGYRFAFQVSVGAAPGTMTTIWADTAGNLSMGAWHHIMAWHDAANDLLGISVNNVADTVSYSSGVRTASYGLRFGLATWGGGSVNGLLDEVAFWKNRVITSGERTQLYNGGSGLDLGSF